MSKLAKPCPTFEDSNLDWQSQIAPIQVAKRECSGWRDNVASGGRHIIAASKLGGLSGFRKKRGEKLVQFFDDLREAAGRFGDPRSF